jgi:hypothetical protein
MKPTIPNSVLAFRDADRVLLWDWLMQALETSIEANSEAVASPELTPDARQHAAGALWAMRDTKRQLENLRWEALNRP